MSVRPARVFGYVVFILALLTMQVAQAAEPRPAVARLTDAGLVIDPINVDGMTPGSLPDLPVREFLLKAGTNEVTIVPNKLAAEPNWWWDPTMGSPTKDAFVTKLVIADDGWSKALASDSIAVKFPIVSSTACRTMTVVSPEKPGDKPAVACDDWSSLKAGDQITISSAALFVPFGSTMKSAKADGNGNFGAGVQGVCDSCLLPAVTRGVVHAFLSISDGKPKPTIGPGVVPVTIQLQTAPPLPKGTIKAQCVVDSTFYSQQLVNDARAALRAVATNEPYRPLLIISYATIQDAFGPWLSSCDDSTPVREKVQFGYVDEPAICLLGARHRRTDAELGLPFFPPGASLRVYVIHPSSVDASLSASQAQGLTALQILPGNGAVSLPSGVGATATAGSLPSPSGLRAEPRGNDTDCILDRYELAPRSAGPFTIVSQLLDPAGAIVPGSIRSIEMLVDQVYVGALRLGFALAFPTYGVRAFGVHQAGNGATEIYQDSYSPAALEVVAGYTGFWKRRYGSEVRCDFWRCPVPSPFVGIGVISGASSTTFNALTSVYVGGEWQLGPLTLQVLPLGLRRDTVLASGFAVGNAVPTSTTTVPTAIRLDWAPAISLTVDGDILKIAGVSIP